MRAALSLARALFASSMLAFAVATSAVAQKAPPNLVVISERLTTSGQPSAEWLRTLKANGFDAVIYLAPPTVDDAVRDEHAIVGGQGLAFINIPVDWHHPSPRDFELLVATLRALHDRKVLVHCQINLRASAMTFLYRTIALKEDPERAYEAVSRVWKPDATWSRFIQSQLERNGITFKPY